jgi:hypothetical protein
MSVIVTANHGETFEVEVFHDGHIEFPDRDLQFEQAMEEFTNSDSCVVQLDRQWEEFPANVIFEKFELPENSEVRLAADCAEHVLHLYENKYPRDFRPRNAIEATRKFVAGEIDLETLEKYKSAAGAAWAVAGAWAAAGARAAAAAAWAADAAATAADAAATAAWAAVVAARAVAHSVSPDNDSPEWQQACDAEVAWQIRRFVDCMEAVGQGFNWPDMKVTS